MNFSNWQLYIDVDDNDPNLRPTLDGFKEKTGVKVNYTEDINDNSSFFAKIAPQLASGQDVGPGPLRAHRLDGRPDDP